MKIFTTLIFVAFVIPSSIAQEKNIETHSVSIENIIPFIVDNYAIKGNGEQVAKNLTFLIQMPETELDGESKIILKQEFKLLSSRLAENDNI